MQYSNKEIYNKIESAANKTEMVKILAQLNGCSTEQIEKIHKDYEKYLEDLGVGIKKGTKIERYPEELKARVINCIKEGMSLKQTIEALDVNVEGSGFSQLYYKLKRENKVYIQPELLSANNKGKDFSVKEDSGIKHEGHKSSITPLRISDDSYKKPTSTGVNVAKSVVEEKSVVITKPTESSVDTVVEKSTSVVTTEQVTNKEESECKVVKEPIKKESMKESKKSPNKLSKDLEQLKDLLDKYKQKKDSLSSVVHTKKTELEMLEATLQSYELIIDDLKYLLEESED